MYYLECFRYYVEKMKNFFAHESQKLLGKIRETSTGAIE